MFTGLIKDVGFVENIKTQQGSILVTIKTKFDIEKINIGSSISCNGCCLTVVNKNLDKLFFEVSNETLDCTNIKLWKNGTLVNLEDSLKLGDEMGGHLVTGHIDCIAKIKNKYLDGDSTRFEISIDNSFNKFIAKKGSVAVDGVSLTVNNVTDNTFDVNIIPHTLKHTNFHILDNNDIVNIEIDLISRYVDRLILNK